MGTHCTCVCVCERERLHITVLVCVCERERLHITVLVCGGRLWCVRVRVLVVVCVGDSGFSSVCFDLMWFVIDWWLVLVYFCVPLQVLVVERNICERIWRADGVCLCGRRSVGLL